MPAKILGIVFKDLSNGDRAKKKNFWARMTVLPYRLVKLRYYGFFSPRKHRGLERVKELLTLFQSEDENIAFGSCVAEVRVMRCLKPALGLTKGAAVP